MEKLLIVKIAYEKIGGIDRQILRISKEIGKRNIITPCLATSDGSLPLAIEFRKLGYSVYEVKIGKEYNIFQGANSLVKIIRQQDISFIQSHLFRESLVCRLAKLKHPYVKHIFRAQTYIDCAWIPEWKKATYHIVDYLSSLFVNIYIANGPEVKKEIVYRSKVPKKKVVSIINGTEFIGQPDVLDSQKIPYKIAMVSNFLEKKGHDTLLKALKLLKMQGLLIHARLIGDEISGGYNDTGESFKQKIINLSNDLGINKQLEFYGYSNDIQDSLKNIPVLVLPSDSEGVPNCILEAMSLKKIVVASDVGAIYTIIKNEKNGYLHLPGNAKVLAATLKHIFSQSPELLNSLRENAYSTWKNNFFIDGMIDELEKQYKKLLS